MEVAKIATKGQITLPLAIRQKLKLKDGDKVAFIEKDGEFIVVNPAKLAILEAQRAFSSLADKLGLKTEDDVVDLCKKVRIEMQENSYADNG